MTSKSLGLIIPVRDDSAALNKLLTKGAELGIFNRVIVVDDGSEDPVRYENATVMRPQISNGPGLARTRGLAEIETDHVLFFDSDDLITPDVVQLWHTLHGRDFDFCLFRHADIRQINRGQWRQMPHDDALWRMAGMGGQHLAHVTLSSAKWLSQTANYPWNKIYRTRFLRATLTPEDEAKLARDDPVLALCIALQRTSGDAS